MKQKVIVRLSLADEKSRKKAMKTVVGHSGVVSAALQGQDKNQMEVIGDGIDSVVITSLLRKSLGYADLVSVNPITEKKDDGGQKKDAGGQKKDDGKKTEVTPQPPVIYTQYPYNYGPYYVEVRDHGYDQGCAIL